MFNMPNTPNVSEFCSTSDCVNTGRSDHAKPDRCIDKASSRIIPFCLFIFSFIIHGLLREGWLPFSLVVVEPLRFVRDQTHLQGKHHSAHWSLTTFPSSFLYKPCYHSEYCSKSLQTHCTLNSSNIIWNVLCALVVLQSALYWYCTIWGNNYSIKGEEGWYMEVSH